MTLLLGGTLGAGVLLMISPWLWPLSDRGRAGARRGPSARLLASAGFAHRGAGSLAALAVGLGLVAAAVAWLSTGVWAFAVVAGGGGASAPYLWLSARGARLRRARRALWPDVCELLTASVRSGMSLPNALAALADSAPGELRPAFAAFREDIAASGHFESSILALKESLSDPVADRIIETLRMARQVGGTELTTVLRSLAASVRADAAIRAEVESRQSWVRGTAVLGVAAPWVVLILLSLRPEGARAYSSPEGVVLVIAGALVSVLAFRVMLRLGRLPEPRRWFG